MKRGYIEVENTESCVKGIYSQTENKADGKTSEKEKIVVKKQVSLEVKVLGLVAEEETYFKGFVFFIVGS